MHCLTKYGREVADSIKSGLKIRYIELWSDISGQYYTLDRGIPMKTRFTVVLFMFSLLFAGQLSATSQDAQDVVKMTADKVLSRIQSERSMLDANPERIYDLVNELVIPHFDFVSMSKWVLGKNWKKATEEQRKEFVEQFRILLVRTYARALLEYSGQQIKYLPLEESPKPNLAVIKTELESKNAQILPVNYRMYNRDGTWKVIDVAVDGVSLTSTYRGSFASEIKKNGIAALIAKLGERNAKLTSASR